MVATAFNNGTFNATIALLDQALKGLGYDNSGSITSQTLIAAIIVGVIVNPLFSFALRKSNAYRLIAGIGNYIVIQLHSDRLQQVFCLL